VRAWRLTLGAGTLALLGVGFVASALANRLIFVAWGLAAASLYALGLRRGFETGDWGLPLLALGAGLLTFGWLLGRNREELDLAFRAFLPALYHPLLTEPMTSYAAGSVLALAGPARRLLRRTP
jgi:hypothetical protein